jgi:uncharacterized membrane protein
MIVEHAVHIAAPSELVWRVTVDVEQWPTWTPTVTAVRRVDGGPFGLGSRCLLRQPGQPEAEWVVTQWEPGRRFAWTTTRRGLRMTGTHEITAEGAGTRNTLRVEASGILMVLLWPLLRLATPRALRDENAGLKAHCERLATRATERP